MQIAKRIRKTFGVVAFVFMFALFLTQTVQNTVVVRNAETFTNSDKTITNKTNQAANKLTDTIKTVVTTWFPPLFIINIAAWALVKNDRTKEMLKRSLIGLCIAYAAVYGIDVLMSIIKQLPEWFKVG